MVKYKYIIQAIDETIKCRAIAQAEGIGATAQWHEMAVERGKWEKIGLEPSDKKYWKVTYDNGTEIYFNIRGDITHLTYPDLDFDENYLGEDSYDFFSDQKQKIIDFYNDGENLEVVGEDWGENGYRDFVQYCDTFASWRGFDTNSYLRGLSSYEEFKGSLEGDGFEILWGRDGGLHDDFCELVANNDLSGYPDFFTLRKMNRLHDNDSEEKRIVWDKAHTSASVGMPNDDFETFVDDVDDSWSVITIHKKGNKASKGVFMGNAINEARAGGWRGDAPDWEKEVHYAPGQRFERLIFDKKSKLIVQVPYEP